MFAIMNNMIKGTCGTGRCSGRVLSCSGRYLCRSEKSLNSRKAVKFVEKPGVIRRAKRLPGHRAAYHRRATETIAKSYEPQPQQIWPLLFLPKNKNHRKKYRMSLNESTENKSIRNEFSPLRETVSQSVLHSIGRGSTHTWVCNIDLTARKLSESFLCPARRQSSPTDSPSDPSGDHPRRSLNGEGSVCLATGSIMSRGKQTERECGQGRANRRRE